MRKQFELQQRFSRQRPCAKTKLANPAFVNVTLNRSYPGTDSSEACPCWTLINYHISASPPVPCLQSVSSGLKATTTAYSQPWREVFVWRFCQLQHLEEIRSKILSALLTFKGRFLKGECWPMKRQDTVIDKVLHHSLSEGGSLESWRLGSLQYR